MRTLTPLPASVFSTRARDILNYALESLRLKRWPNRATNARAVQDPTGLVVEEDYTSFWLGLSSFVKWLMDCSKTPGKPSTMASRAADTRIVLGPDVQAREASLLGYIFRGVAEEKIVKRFGQEAVRKLKGHPVNPMAQAQREALWREVNKLSEQHDEEEIEIYTKWEKARESDAALKEVEELAACDRKFKAARAELEAKMDAWI